MMLPLRPSSPRLVHQGRTTSWSATRQRGCRHPRALTVETTLVGEHAVDAPEGDGECGDDRHHQHGEKKKEKQKGEKRGKCA